MFACFKVSLSSHLLHKTWASMCVFFADNEDQLNQEERSFLEDPVNVHLFAEAVTPKYRPDCKKCTNKN